MAFTNVNAENDFYRSRRGETSELSINTTMEYGWPQYTYIALASVGLLIAARDHGKPKTGNDNFFITAIATGITVALMKAGGFF